MNVALPAIVLFVLLIPGFIFRAHYKRVERISLDYSPFGAVVLSGTAWAVGLHIIWLGVSYLACGRVVDLHILASFLAPSPEGLQLAVSKAKPELGYIAAYFATILTIPVGIAIAFQECVTRLGWDRGRLKFLFRFTDAPWFYLLTARDEEEVPDLIKVAAVVEIGKEPMLIVGVLDDFEMNPDGSLNRLILSYPSRRPLSSDRSERERVKQAARGDPDTRFYPIESNAFVVQYEQVITLNLEYIHLDREKSSLGLRERPSKPVPKRVAPIRRRKNDGKNDGRN
ncbi:MAG: hypothetical protein QM674_16235 [Burkholderiaceae bacterium]